MSLGISVAILPSSITEGHLLLNQLGALELIVIFIIAIILFGPKKIPDLAKSIGKAMYEFRKASSGAYEAEVKEMIEKELKLKPTKKEEGVEKKEEKSDMVILETAKEMGIEVEGKTIQEVAEEIVIKAKEKGILKEVREAEKPSIEAETKSEKVVQEEEGQKKVDQEKAKEVVLKDRVEPRAETKTKEASSTK